MTFTELKGLKGLQNLKELHNDLEHLQNLNTANHHQETIQQIPIEKLISGQFQPRTQMNETALTELSTSIRQEGILLPLIVRERNVETKSVQYEIIAGERRWRAAKMADLKTIPVIVRNITDSTALAFAIIENIQRESLNPIDEANAFARLKDDFGMTHEDIAQRVGRSRSAVTNLLRLLSLAEEVKTYLLSEQLEMGHARALLTLDPIDQCLIAQKIIENQLSVRETEKLVRASQHKKSSSQASNLQSEQLNNWKESLQQLITSHIHSRVKVSLNNKKKGKIIFYIQNENELIEFLKIIQHKEL